MSIFENKGFFIPRYDAEYNDAMQQIIPYTIILNKNESKMYVSYRIDGDPRLNNVYSLGFGGHINIEDIYSLNNDNYYSLIEVLLIEKYKKKFIYITIPLIKL